MPNAEHMPYWSPISLRPTWRAVCANAIRPCWKIFTKCWTKGLPNTALGMNIKKEAMRLGLHRDLNLDSISGEPYTAEELERLDAFTEEIANEKILVRTTP